MVFMCLQLLESLLPIFISADMIYMVLRRLTNAIFPSTSEL